MPDISLDAAMHLMFAGFFIGAGWTLSAWVIRFILDNIVHRFNGSWS